MTSRYDVVIIGAGHNGLTAAAYLSRAGLRTLVLEKNACLGGATTSQRLFPDFDAHLSQYAYLVSLFPEKIIQDLQLRLPLRTRSVASFTPYVRNQEPKGLLIRNGFGADTAQSLYELTGNHRELARLRAFYALSHQFAQRTWDTMLRPLESREAMQRRFAGSLAEEAWRSLVEEPLGCAIDRYLTHDLLKGLVFTDAKIGVLTHPEDPSLLQNRTFLYHLIGNGTGEWKVPVGGMGRVSTELAGCAIRHGTEVRTEADVQSLHAGTAHRTVAFTHRGNEYEVQSEFVLVNAGPNVLARLLGQHYAASREDEGSVFKVNMLCQRLPQPKGASCPAAEAFAGTFHLDEGYEAMRHSYRQAAAGQLPDRLPAELYCHTLTDNSILSETLRRDGFHTLTLFGLDVPYAWFEADPEGTKRTVLRRYLDGLNRHLAEPIEACLATDRAGSACVEAKSPVDLEHELGLHRGNIFHNALTFPFADHPTEVGTWGVETGGDKICLCGSGAKRGGAVSGIPGHNAAMKVLGY